MRTPSTLALLLSLAFAGGCMMVAGVDFGAAHERDPLAELDGDVDGAGLPGPGPGGCPAGHADCDKNEANGCEANLANPATCGSCGKVCGGAALLCAGGNCVASCPAGFVECSGSCVDTKTSLEHCGLCGRACAAPANGDAVCLNGGCGFACRAGFGDCANNPAQTCDALPKWFRDADGDTFGGATAISACTAPAGYIAKGGDCLDTNPQVFPGQTALFGVPFTNAAGALSFDYDCNGAEAEGTPVARFMGCGGACNEQGFTPSTVPRPGAPGFNAICGSTVFHVCFDIGMGGGCQHVMPMNGPVTCH